MNKTDCNHSVSVRNWSLLIYFKNQNKNGIILQPHLTWLKAASDTGEKRKMFLQSRSNQWAFNDQTANLPEVDKTMSSCLNERQHSGHGKPSLNVPNGGTKNCKRNQNPGLQCKWRLAAEIKKKICVRWQMSTAQKLPNAYKKEMLAL